VSMQTRRSSELLRNGLHIRMAIVPQLERRSTSLQSSRARVVRHSGGRNGTRGPKSDRRECNFLMEKAVAGPQASQRQSGRHVTIDTRATPWRAQQLPG
jgi:hypothetical protein